MQEIDERNLGVSIREVEGEYANFRRKGKASYAAQYEIMNLLYELYWSQIHEYLVPLNTLDGEREIRRHIKVAIKLLGDCKSKVEFIEGLPNKDMELLGKYLVLYENLYALVSFRSLEHFALFMEWDTPDDKKVWKYSMEVLKGIFYYSNLAVLDYERKIKLVMKQLATGVGKTYSDKFIQAFILGIDINNEIISVVGNPSLINRGTETLVQLMTNKRYAKVFPYFRQFHGGGVLESVANKMFKTIKVKDGELAITGSLKPVNFSMFGKDTPFDGVRARFLFLDDICRSKDAGNIKMHDKDLERFDQSWFKRNYNEHDFVIFIGGTAYSIYDIMSTLKRRYSNNVFVKSPVDRHTHLSGDGKAVFVRVPKLDYKTDESLFPRKYSTEEARKARARDLKTFMAMDQQMPLPPESTPFYWDNLTRYAQIPEERPTYSYAVLDPARKGANFNAMGIHIPIKDKDGNEKHYLVDCVYEQRPIDEMYDHIVDKIIKHRVIKLVIEKNIDLSLKKVLTEKLRDRNVFFCEIIEIYTSINKESKIRSAESSIRHYIVFPEQEIYARSSQMGRYMEDIVSFQYDKMSSRTQFDDSIDCEAMYKDQFIADGVKRDYKSRAIRRW